MNQHCCIAGRRASEVTRAYENYQCPNSRNSLHKWTRCASVRCLYRETAWCDIVWRTTLWCRQPNDAWSTVRWSKNSLRIKSSCLCISDRQLHFHLFPRSITHLSCDFPSPVNTFTFHTLTFRWTWKPETILTNRLVFVVSRTHRMICNAGSFKVNTVLHWFSQFGFCVKAAFVFCARYCASTNSWTFSM